MNFWGTFTILFTLLISASSFAIEFDTYLPSSKNNETAVYIVMHGCKQVPSDILADTRFKELADKYNYAVVTPKQNIFMNYDKCWNWFLPVNQYDVIGSEITTIMSFVNRFKRNNDLKNHPTYAIGFSSGAAQVMNLMACFPEEIDGIAVHSGIAYQGARNIYEANETISKGPSASSKQLVYRMKTCSPLSKWENKSFVLFQGKEDSRVVPANFNSIKGQLLGVMDIQDDGLINNSHILSRTEEDFDPPLMHSYKYEYYGLKNDNDLHTYLVEDMAHDWSGGPVRIGRNDPKGPDATKIIIDFFF